MASYNGEDYREAVRRVNEMHRRSREAVNRSNSSVEAVPPAPTAQTAQTAQPQAHAPHRDSPAGHQQENSGAPGSLSELMAAFNIDEEKALIGLVIYILAKNGADVKLLLGLGYLLL